MGLRLALSIFITAVASLLCSVPAWSDGTLSCMKCLNVEDGLSQSMVYCIHQDSRGFMWFGTQDGLNRYDGHEIVVFRRNPDDPQSVGSDNYFTIFENDDHKLWLGTFNGVFIYDPRLEKFTFFDAHTEEGKAVGGKARSICRDRSGNVWIACQNGEVFRYDSEGGLVEFNLEKLLGMDATVPINLRRIETDSKGKVWVATYGNGVLCLDPEASSVTRFVISETDPEMNDVNTLYILSDNNILLGTSAKGVQSLDCKSGKITPFLEREPVSGNTLFVRQIIGCSDKMIWIGTESGVYVYNMKSSRVSSLNHTYGDPYSLSDNAVHSIYEDRDGGVWVGTYFGGVNYIQKSPEFERFYNIPGKNTIGGKRISEFCQGDSGMMWIATEDAGLFSFDPGSRSFSAVNVPAGNIHALMYDSGRLWVGSFAEGLFIMDTSTGRIRRLGMSSGQAGMKNNSIYAVFKDSWGTVWIGMMSGLYRYVSEEDIFEEAGPDGPSDVQVNDIVEDAGGRLWFATMGEGIYSYDRQTGVWRRYMNVSSSYGTSGSYVACLLEDGRGRLWAGTEGDGLCLYDKDKDSFSSVINTRNGLLSDVVSCLECDRSGNIWGGTNKGLFRMDAVTFGVRTYTHSNGLPSDQFNYKSCFMDIAGKVYFGSINGFVSFVPERMSKENRRPEVCMTDLLVNNRKVRPGDQYGLLDSSIMDTKRLVVRPGIKNFTLCMTEINYVPAHNTNWYYSLENWDRQWIPAKMPARVTYSNLPAGKYVLHVRADNIDSTDAASLEIVVKPPFHRTTFAYVMYFVLMTCASGVGFSLAKRKMEREKEEGERRRNEEKEREIYKAKITFFSNITHEIRTPLSLMKMPLEEIISHRTKSDADYDNLLIIRDNTDRLMNLVNQLLDFRKVNGSGIEPQFVRADLTKVLGGVVHRFLPSARLKGCDLESDIPESLMADVDVEMFVKIVSNLLSNALKHADGHIWITMAQVADSCEISVTNDGDRIPPELSEKIFSPYFKVDENSDGFGIGLPFARSMAEIHKGSLRLTDGPDGMTRFTITLPLEQENAFRCLDNVLEVPEIVTGGSSTDSEKTLLLVEDDMPFVDFITRHLSGKYNIIKAGGGKRALEILSNNHVDLVLSDVVMPGMNGIELCRAIKGDPRLRHIPVIFLTAEVSPQFKADAALAGADDYLGKPVYMDFLVSSIENQLRNGYVSETIRNIGETEPSNLVYTKADESFLNALTQLINDHLEEADLDVNKLASLMNMSRATLYRKVKESLKVTPNDFIRVVRLKKAAELLRQKEYRINEIAYITGFSSSSYFSRCFYRQYGVLPKDFC